MPIESVTEATTRSLATPTAGLAVTPDHASDPPHSTATVNSDSGIGSRTALDTCCVNSRAMPSPRPISRAMGV